MGDPNAQFMGHASNRCAAALAAVVCATLVIASPAPAASWSEESSHHWQTPRYLDPQDGDVAPTAWLEPDMTMDGKGRVLVVWKRNGRSLKQILASRYDPEQGWIGPSQVYFGEERASSPKVAASDSGQALVVWYQEKSGGGSELWAREYDPSNDWGKPYRIGNANPYASETADVVIDKTGNGLIVWLEKGGLRCRLIHLGSPIPTENDCQDRYADHPAAAVNNGHAVVVWRTAGDEDYVITAQRYVPGTGWMGQEPIAAGPLWEKGSGGEPIPVVDQHGNVTVLWVGGVHLYATRYDKASDSWSNVASINDPKLEDVSGVTAVVDDVGTVTAAWTQLVGPKGYGNSIWLSEYAPKGWTVPVSLPTEGGHSINPAITSARAGSGTVVWLESHKNRVSVWATHYDKLGAWAPPKRIGGTTIDFAKPKIVEDKEGRAVAIWPIRVKPENPENVRLCVNIKNRRRVDGALYKLELQEDSCQNSLQHGYR